MEFFTIKPPVFHRAGRKQFKWNSCKRFLACELEIARADDGGSISHAVRRWKGSIVEDGSLPESGFEICTSPANGDLFIEQIRDICRALSSQDASVNVDCGFHVHADARDLTYWDVRKVILLYGKVEDALFEMVPKSRRENQYCQRCGQKYTLELEGRLTKNKIIDKVYNLEEYEGSDRGQMFKTVKGEHYNRARYHALNLHSWFHRGTIECRLAAGTTDARKIINWALLWAGLIDFANTKSESTIRNLEGTAWEILRQVAPTNDIRNWLEERRLKFKEPG